MISVLYTIPLTQFDENEKRKLPTSRILSTVGTRCLCEAMVDNIDQLKNAYYGEEILGAWQGNGLQLGLEYQTDTIGTDDEGNDITEQSIVGEPVLPFNDKEYIKYLQDVVTYDEEGNELTRQRPTEVSFMHNWLGWEDKILT